MSIVHVLSKIRSGIVRLVYWKWFGVLNSALVLLLLYFLLTRQAGRLDLKSVIADINYGWLLTALLLAPVTIMVTSLRTLDIFTRESGTSARLSSIIRLQFIATFLNNILPISLATDVARVGMFRMRFKLDYETCTRIVVFDRILGALGVVVVGILTFGVQLLLYEEQLRYLETFQLTMLACAVVFVLALIALARWRLELRWSAIQVIWSWVSILGWHFHNRDFLLRQFAYALLYVGMVYLTMQCLSWALNFDVPPLLLIAFTPVILFVNNLPFLYAGWGGRELITVVTLSNVGGVPARESFLLSIAFGLVMVVAALPGSVFWILRPTFNKQHPSSVHQQSPAE